MAAVEPWKRGQFDAVKENKLFDLTDFSTLSIVCFDHDLDYAKSIHPSAQAVYRSKHPNGEWNIQLPCSVRNHHVYIVWRVNKNINDEMIALFLLVDACARSDAQTITILAPFYPYGRSDKKDNPRSPIGCTWILFLFSRYPTVKRMITLDLHAGQTVAIHEGIENLYMKRYIFDILKFNICIDDSFVFIAPDAGAGKATEKYAARYNLPCIIIPKIRDTKTNQLVESHAQIRHLFEEIARGKRGILIDDMACTMGTLRNAIHTLKDAGLLSLTIIVTHGILSKGSEWLDEEPLIDNMYVGDTIAEDAYGFKYSSKIRLFSTSDIMTKAIYCLQTGNSLSEIFI
jgi:ribose-phosphate pyrophosphokinase